MAGSGRGFVYLAISIWTVNWFKQDTSKSDLKQMKHFRQKIKDHWSRTTRKRPDDEAKGGSGISSSPAPTTRPTKTSSVTKATTQPAPHVKSSAPRSLSPVPTSPAPAPAPTDQPPASDKASHPTCADIDPWARAWAIVQERERELMVDYKRHIASLQEDASSQDDIYSQDDTSAQGDLFTPRNVESVVNKLIEVRNGKQWRVSLLGNDVKIREQVERLAKFLLWSDPVVKQALSIQPYAALAWSGVSILIPVSK